MRKTMLTIVGVASMIVLGGSATYSSLCSFSSGSSYFDTHSYCHNAVQVNYHIISDCPCRSRGSVSASGPFQCAFHSIVQWGGAFNANTITQDAPTAMVTTYDITLDCGESYRVSLSCSCLGRPSHEYFNDQGHCDGPCENDPPQGG